MDVTRTIACLVFPDAMSLDITGPMQVFASANVERQRQGLPARYELLLIGETAGPVATSADLKMVADTSWSSIEPTELDTLLIPGGAGVERQKGNQPLLDWLRGAEPKVRRLGSVCSGALILAEAGLFDGRIVPTPRVGIQPPTPQRSLVMPAYRRKTLRGFPPYGRDDRRGAFVGWTTRSLSTSDRSHAPRGNQPSTLRRLSVMPAYPWWKTHSLSTMVATPRTLKDETSCPTTAVPGCLAPPISSP